MASLAVRAVATTAAALALAGCGGAEGDPHRFEGLALRVADIAVPLEPGAKVAGGAPDSVRAGLRPAHFAPLTVEVLEPHDLWDARDGLLRDAAVRAAPVVAAKAAGLRPALPPVQAPVAAPKAEGRMIQLGAFSTEAAARAAWAEAGRGPAGSMLRGRTPAFEAVEVDGRRLTRLKVGPIPADSVAALCVAAQVADPWCRRAG